MFQLIKVGKKNLKYKLIRRYHKNSEYGKHGTQFAIPKLNLQLLFKHLVTEFENTMKHIQISSLFG